MSALKPSIGIVTAEQSMSMIKEIHPVISRNCCIEYLPYNTPRQLSSVYRQNAYRFDGLIFSGRFPYEYIVNHVGNIIKPHTYFELTDRDYYKAFTKLLYRFPGIDISRILIDKPTGPMDFHDVFGDTGPAFFDVIVGNASGMEFAYEKTMEQALRMWRGKKIDFVLTRFTNLIEMLQASNIPAESLFPSEASMLESFYMLYSRIQSRRLRDAMTASGIVSKPDGCDDRTSAAFYRALAAFNEQNGMSMVIHENTNAFELTTSNEILKDITQEYTNCLLTGCLHEGFGSSICVGWGLGRDIVSARQNADRAFKESQRDARHYAYIVNEQNEQVGPLIHGRGVTLNNNPGPTTEKISRQLGISPANLQKLINVQEKRGTCVFSSMDLAFYLNITPRSANRILIKLAQHGGARIIRSVQSNARGRPCKIYEVDYRKLSPELLSL